MGIELFEFVGAIHAHSTHSDGGGTVQEILAETVGAGIDYLVLTDHNTLCSLDAGDEGWQDKVLLIVGDEVSSRHGHCLALGIETHVDHRQSADGVLAGIRKQGGHTYIAHPHGRYRPLLKEIDHGWKAWDTEDFTGIELWSYMFDWASSFRFTSLISHYRNPDDQIKGPTPETIVKWDELCQKRRVVALGSVDAHARKTPLIPIVVFPYRQLFQAIRTHILCSRPLSGDSVIDKALVLSTLAAGRCYICFDGLADGAGARFQTADGTLSMGDEAIFQGKTELQCKLPEPAEVSLVRNGRTIKTATTTELTHQADTPGVYRMEARIDGRPWLYTNPIYLRSESVDRTDS
jgi:hypothetical protein